MSSSSPSLVGPQAEPFPIRFTAPLFVGSALNPINSSLIATALVAIAAGVHVSAGRAAVLVSGLYLASAIAQPTAGKAADVFGPRRVFLLGILLVLAGGVVGGLAPDLAVLLVSRVLIGLGTSCAYPTAVLMIRRRARDVGLEQPPGGVLGGLQIAGTATASLGLPIGGLLVQAFGWRAVFWINVPVALIALGTTLVWVRRDPPVQHRSAGSVVSALDVPGIVGFALAVASLLGFLSGLPEVNWPLLAATVVLSIAETLWELRAKTPFFDVRLLATHPGLSLTYLRFGLVLLSTYLVLYGVTQWIEASRGLSAALTGLLLLPMTAVSAFVIPPISHRNLLRGPLIWAAIACLVAGGVALLLPVGAWLAVVLVIAVVLGLAGGFASSNQLALYGHAPAEQLGTASGLLRSFGYVGSIASSAITGIVFRDGVDDSGVLVLAAIMLGVGVVLVLVTALDRGLARTASS